MPLKSLSPIHRVTRQISIWFEERTPGLASTEGHLISYLRGYGPCAVSELVRVFGVKHSTMTSTLDRLEKQGLLERTLNDDDRRSFLVALTRKGQSVATKLVALIDELEREIDRRLTKKDLQGFDAVIKAIDAATKVEVRKRK